MSSCFPRARTPATADDISIVIVSLKRPRELDATLRSIGAAANVRVLLNGANREEYRNVITHHQSSVEFVENPRNLGVSAAFNQGIVLSDTRYVVLSGDDVGYDDNWMQPLLEALNSASPPMQVSLSEPLAFSSFCLDKTIIARQGWFDQCYTRIYYEDDDWSLRTMEQLGLGREPVSCQSVMPRLGVVHRPEHKAAPWNSIPNRVRFWSKWERVAVPAPDTLYVRPNVLVRRKLAEPSWPHLEPIREGYARGDFSAKRYHYDPPPLGARLLTAATTNLLFIGLRKLVQRLTNPDRELR